MRVGLLGLQGAFLDHIPNLKKCGADHIIVKDRSCLFEIDRLIIPGGESTVISKYLVELGLLDPLLERIDDGMPVWGICAGAVVLAEKVDQDRGIIGALPVHVQRNAYGRQEASSVELINIPVLCRKNYPAVFIRAPRIVDADNSVSVLARKSNDPVFIRKKHIIATTFHPELIADPVFHHFFFNL
jgi:5'-phosphate synthase pdxT subunit